MVRFPPLDTASTTAHHRVGFFAPKRSQKFLLHLSAPMPSATLMPFSTRTKHTALRNWHKRAAWPAFSRCCSMGADKHCIKSQYSRCFAKCSGLGPSWSMRSFLGGATNGSCGAPGWRALQTPGQISKWENTHEKIHRLRPWHQALPSPGSQRMRGHRRSATAAQRAHSTGAACMKQLIATWITSAALVAAFFGLVAALEGTGGFP